MKQTLALIGLLAACTDDAVPTDEGVVLKMTAAIPAGTELEYCKFVEIPDAWVTRDHVEFTEGSHHVLVYQTSYTTIPTKKDDGTPVDTSSHFDCTTGATTGWSITKLIGGSQNRDGASVLSFPDGVAAHVGGIAMINVHYLNATDEPLETNVKITFDTIAEEKVTQEGDILFLYNPLISIPGNSTARAQWSCPVYQDIHIANVQSHMHKRGVGYEARVSGGAPIYTNTEWEKVPVRDLGIDVKAGSTLDYFCDYKNSEARHVYQGTKTTDEMCMLIGSYYPADVRTANCLDESGKLPGGNWVGQGTKTCAETLGCLQATQGNLQAVTDCVQASKADVSVEVSSALRCFMSATNPLMQCGPQISACNAK